MVNFPKVDQSTSGGYYMGNLDSIAEFLEDNGYSRAAAAGVAGTVAGESAGNPEQANGGGLIQNTPPIAGLYTGNAQADFDNQLTNLLQYANSNSAEAVARGGVNLSTFKQATSPTQAATWWGDFEGPAVPGSDVRANVANQVYSDIGSYKPGTQYTQPSTGGSGTPSGATATAILDAFPGGAADPLNWPTELGNAEEGAAGNIAAGIGSGIESAIMGLFGNVMQKLGFKSGKDFLIRASLILMGAIILIIGIKAFVSNTSATTVFSGAPSGAGDGGESRSDESENEDSGRSAGRRAAIQHRGTAPDSSPSKTTGHKQSIEKNGKYGPEKVLGKDAVKAAVVA